MADKKIVFLHIPKTGGQSLRKIAESNYKKHERFACYPSNPDYPGVDELAALGSDEVSKLKLICGHVDFGIHERLPYECEYFTMMRHPIDRVISAYQHILRRNEKCTGFSLLKIFESKRLLLDNHQTRMLSGENPDFDKCNEEMVWKAIAHIENHFSFVGINERFDKSVSQVGKRYGWKVVEGEKVNVTPEKKKRGVFSKYELKTIEHQNRFDMMLYSYVKQRFFSAADETPDIATVEVEAKAAAQSEAPAPA